MSFDLEYNSERPLLIIPEYGRHIQKLVDHCVSLPTKEERNIPKDFAIAWLVEPSKDINIFEVTS